MAGGDRFITPGFNPILDELYHKNAAGVANVEFGDEPGQVEPQQVAPNRRFSPVNLANVLRRKKGSEQPAAEDPNDESWAYEDTQELPIYSLPEQKQGRAGELKRKLGERASAVAGGARSGYETYVSWRDLPDLEKEHAALEETYPWAGAATELGFSSTDVDALLTEYAKAEEQGKEADWLDSKARSSVADDVPATERPDQIDSYNAKFKEIIDHWEDIPEDDEALEKILGKVKDVQTKYEAAQANMDNLSTFQAKIARGVGAVRDGVRKATYYPFAAGMSWLHTKLSKEGPPDLEAKRRIRTSNVFMIGSLAMIAYSRFNNGVEALDLNALGNVGELPDKIGPSPLPQASPEAPGPVAAIPEDVVVSPEDIDIPPKKVPEVETPTLPTVTTIDAEKGDNWWNVAEDLLHEKLVDDDGKRIKLDMGKRDAIMDALKAANPEGIKIGGKIDISAALEALEQLKEEAKNASKEINADTTLYEVQKGDTVEKIADKILQAKGVDPADTELRKEVIDTLLKNNHTYNGDEHWVDKGQVFKLKEALDVVDIKLEQQGDSGALQNEAADLASPDLEGLDATETGGGDAEPGAAISSESSLNRGEDLALSEAGKEASMRYIGVPRPSWSATLAIAEPILISRGLAHESIFGNVIIDRNLLGIFPKETSDILRQAAVVATKRS